MQQMGVNVARLPVMWMAAAWELSGTLGGRKQLQVDCRQICDGESLDFQQSSTIFHEWHATGSISIS